MHILQVTIQKFLKSRISQNTIAIEAGSNGIKATFYDNGIKGLTIKRLLSPLCWLSTSKLIPCSVIDATTSNYIKNTNLYCLLKKHGHIKTDKVNRLMEQRDRMQQLPFLILVCNAGFFDQSPLNSFLFK